MDATAESQKGASSIEDAGVAVKIEEKVGGEEDSCPIAKNAALLEELDAAEGMVAELLEVAADALDELAGVESLDSSKVEASTKKFLDLVSSVHGTLSSKAELIRDYTPYPRSIYGPRKELELLHEKARFLRTTLADLSKEQPASTARKEPPELNSPPQDGGGGAGAAV
ncbi:unnamed protein product [Ectocarpus sp. 13 AM-2016]